MTWLLFVLIMQAKYYAQDTGNQCSILGCLICWKWRVPDCEKLQKNKNGNCSIWNKFYRTEQNRIFIGLKSIYKGLLPKQHIKYNQTTYTCLKCMPPWRHLVWDLMSNIFIDGPTFLKIIVKSSYISYFNIHLEKKLLIWKLDF